MAKFTLIFTHILVLFLLVQHVVGPPAKPQKQNEDSSKNDEHDKVTNDDVLTLEYNRYLSEVVNVLESDPEFRKQLETAQEADFRNGKVASDLKLVSHHVRGKLNELKRIELQRLRDLVKQAEYNNRIIPDHIDAQHIDHSNPHTFESADLDKLITKVRKDLAELDRKRREEFKEYELQKKFEQEQQLKAMDEEHKKKYMQEFEEKKKKLQKHEPLHHPGSRAQLEEVWKNEDHMDNQKFNPRTFFYLHDLNSDGHLDDDEVKALFVKELEKMQEGIPKEDIDLREREEELERMREHVFKEADTNGDRLISYEEFLVQTKKQEFNNDEGWETIDSQPQFTQQEYEEFERRRQEEIQHLIDQGLLQPYAPGMMPPPPPGYAGHPGQFQQGYHSGAVDPNHMQAQQYGQNVGYHPQQGVPNPQQRIPQYPQQGMPHHSQPGMPQQPQQGALPQHTQQGMPQHSQQGLPQHSQQGLPQHSQQGLPQHMQQGVPERPQQGVPQHPQQGVPYQNTGQAQGQYSGQQYYSNQGAGQPHGQVPAQGSNHLPQLNSLPQQNAVPLGQAQQPASSHQQNMNSNQGIPPPNQANQPSPPNHQYNQQQNPSQGTYGSQAAAQPSSYKEGNINSNHINSDINKDQSNNMPKRRR